MNNYHYSQQQTHGPGHRYSNSAGHIQSQQLPSGYPTVAPIPGAPGYPPPSPSQGSFAQQQQQYASGSYDGQAYYQCPQDGQHTQPPPAPQARGLQQTRPAGDYNVNPDMVQGPSHYSPSPGTNSQPYQSPQNPHQQFRSPSPSRYPPAHATSNGHYETMPDRPVSPRPQLQEALFQPPLQGGPATASSPGHYAAQQYAEQPVNHAYRSHSPQPRRYTMPNPLLENVNTSWQTQPAPEQSYGYQDPSWQGQQPRSPTTSSPLPPIPQPHKRYVPPYRPPSQPAASSPSPASPARGESIGSMSKRPLPTVPGANAQQAFSIPTMASPGIAPSPNLSRSSSAASTSSVGSSSGRRPLPKPPSLPPLQDTSPSSQRAYEIDSPTGARPRSPRLGNSISNPPASYAQAEAAVRERQMSAGGSIMPQINLPAEDRSPEKSNSTAETEVTDMRALTENMQRMSTNQDSRSNGASVNDDAPSINVEAAAEPASQRSTSPPTISIPVFSFDEPDDQPDSKKGKSAGPSISISVAPPSPRLTATSDDYFEAKLEDEGVPLPVSSVPMATTTKAYALACPGCAKPVLYGRTVNAMGKRWHPDCFQCAQCGEKLEHMEFFTKDGKPYCHVDYHELFSIRCSHCHTPIVDESYITVDDDALGGKKTFHELHFFCANCGDPFVDPKARGAGPDGGVGAQAKPFTVHNGHAYCEACNTRLHKTKCSSCKKPIQGDVLRALNRNWCEDCFKCDSCEDTFEDGTFLVYQGKPHCEDCYKVKLRSES